MKCTRYKLINKKWKIKKKKTVRSREFVETCTVINSINKIKYLKLNNLQHYVILYLQQLDLSNTLILIN